MNPKRSPIRIETRFSSNQEPLYRRLPTHDRLGRRLSDFMMLIPGLRNLAAEQLRARLETLQENLQASGEVVFAELNLPLNLLWVSLETRGGAIPDLIARIRSAFPQARLVGHPAHDHRRPSAARRQRIARGDSEKRAPG